MGFKVLHLAGDASGGYGYTDSADPTAAEFNAIADCTFSEDYQYLYVADYENYAVRRVAMFGTFEVDTLVDLTPYKPMFIHVHPTSGNLYVTARDVGVNTRIYQITPGGSATAIKTYAYDSGNTLWYEIGDALPDDDELYVRVKREIGAFSTYWRWVEIATGTESNPGPSMADGAYAGLSGQCWTTFPDVVFTVRDYWAPSGMLVDMRRYTLHGTSADYAQGWQPADPTPRGLKAVRVLGDYRERESETMYSTSVLGYSPQIYLRLSETGASNPVDSSTYARACTLNATYTWGVAGALVSDPANTAIDMSSGNIQVTSRVAMTGSKTVMAWVKTTQSDSSSSYAGNAGATIVGDTTGSVWESFGLHGGKVRYTRFNGSTWETFDSSATVNDDAWHMVAVTYDSGTKAVKLYIDGAEDGSGTMSTHNVQGGFNRIGDGYGLADTYLGDLDEVAVFASVLTASQIEGLYDEGSTNPPPTRPYDVIAFSNDDNAGSLWTVEHDAYPSAFYIAPDLVELDFEVGQIPFTHFDYHMPTGMYFFATHGGLMTGNTSGTLNGIGYNCIIVLVPDDNLSISFA